MSNHIFFNLKSDKYFTQVISKIPNSNLNDEQVIKVFIALTDELRRTDSYTSEIGKIIFSEVENRIGNTTVL